MIQPKPVSQSSIEDHIHKIFPKDLNANGTVFGGLIMGTCDRIALVVAERHSERTCVTVSIDSVQFLRPAGHGDTLLFSVSVNRSWHTSMEIGVKVVAENDKTRHKRHIVSAYFTFVALDDHKNPTKVAPVIPETALERRRYEEAEVRRKSRQNLAEAHRIKKMMCLE